MLENQIIQGDALSVLRTMPNESIQCVITSPPYYGLRSYGTNPQIWSNHNGCQHIWGEAIKYAKEDKRTPEVKAAQGSRAGSSVNSINWAQGNSGVFCLDCNAWRGELGLEPMFQLYISHLIEIFAEIKRVLKNNGTCFVNLGDSYTSSGGASRHFGYQDPKYKNGRNGGHVEPTAFPQSVRPKSLMNIPARFAITMTDELQMIQRNEIIWHKPACMPSSATDRFTVDFEPVYFFAKNPKYKFNQQFENFADDRMGNPGSYKWNYGIETNQGQSKGSMIKPSGMVEGWNINGEKEGRNKRTTWRIPFEPQSDEHYASYPTKLVEPMILAGTDEGDTVLDIFAGTGTTLLTAYKLDRKFLGIELNPKYVDIANKRLEPYLAQSKLF